MSWQEWIRTVEVEPSLYAADFAKLGEQVDGLIGAGARVLHFDVGDGHFVEPVTIGPIVLASISERVHRLGGVFDVHLMTETPEKHFAAVAAAGGDSVTVHYEACGDLPAAVRAAREQQLQIGLAFKPETAVEAAAGAAEGFDLVLCMSIQPGYSGQAFMPDAFGRIRRLRELLGPDRYIQVDGGVDGDNVRAVHEAGADLLVAGSAIFGQNDIAGAYLRLVQALA